jgi:hypothetical protein
VQMLELLGSRGYILARLGPGVWLKAASKMGRTGLALPANIPYGPVPMPRISPVHSPVAARRLGMHERVSVAPEGVRPQSAPRVRTLRSVASLTLSSLFRMGRLQIRTTTSMK